MDFEKEKAFKACEKNIISWYPFDKKSKIVLMGTTSKEIIDELSLYSENILVYNEKEKSTIEADYLIFLGIEKNKLELEKNISKAKDILKPNGKMLIVFDNKYSIKNMSTDKGIEKIYNNNLYTLEEVLELLDKNGLTNRKMYYPLNDYIFTNVIFTDYMPISKSNVPRNIFYNENDTIKFFEENEMLNNIVENNVEMKKYANSFLLEVFNGEVSENNIRLVAFSNMRKKQYKIKTIVEKDNVYKYADNEESKKHIEDIKKNIDIMQKIKLKTIDSYDEEKIISQYINEETLDKKILKKIDKNKNLAIALIKKYKEKLEECLEITNDNSKNIFEKYSIKCSDELLNTMKFVKYGLWDLIFQNCFYIDDEFYFYDQEWIEENIPIEFIIYRAIYYLPLEKNDKITHEELYEYFELTNEKIELFKKLDEALQDKINNKLIWDFQRSGQTVEQIRLTYNHEINLLRSEVAQKNEQINDLVQENLKINNELNIIKSSRGWKAIEKIRNLRNKEGKKK